MIRIKGQSGQSRKDDLAAAGWLRAIANSSTVSFRIVRLSAVALIGWSQAGTSGFSTGAAGVTMTSYRRLGPFAGPLSFGPLTRGKSGIKLRLQMILDKPVSRPPLFEQEV
jgi:hypothetical protein